MAKANIERAIKIGTSELGGKMIQLHDLLDEYPATPNVFEISDERLDQPAS